MSPGPDTSAAPGRPAAPRLAGRYTVGPRRGRGPATDTHPGWDHVLDRPVTIERYRPTARPAHRYRRERTVAALARVDHPAVLAVLDRGVDATTGEAFVVTEPLDGITLAERIERGPQSLPRVLALGAALAGALAHLHAAGLVHRRLTPSTIMMTRRGTPVLFDLDGVGDLDVESVTVEEAIALTDAVHLAPEQIAGEEVGPTADVYSLARILEACLAAPAVHAGAPRTVPATPTPPAVRSLFAAMTDRDPERRLGAARVVDELAALVSELARAPQPTPQEPTPQEPVAPVPSPGATGTTSLPTTRRPAPLPRARARRARHRRAGGRRAALVAALVLGLGIELAALGAGVAFSHDTPANHPNEISTPAPTLSR